MLREPNSKKQMEKKETQRTAPPRKATPIPDEQHILNLEGFIQTVDTAPTAAPRNFYQSIKIVVDSLSSPTTYHLYIYSVELGAWVKFTGAAA